ncbi:MAG: orotate phosphoribosyltransferase [bacterium]
MTDNKIKNKLIDLIVLKSVKVSDEPIFELASGKKSNIYIDCRKTTCNAAGQFLVGNLIFAKIANLDVHAIGGLTLGADPIANAVSYTSGIKKHPINAFIVRKTPKGHGLKKMVEGDVKENDKVVIVDDVVTTGASTIEAIQKARNFGLEIKKVIVLVDRQEGGKENILKEGFEFEAMITKEELLEAYYTQNSKL